MKRAIITIILFFYTLTAIVPPAITAELCKVDNFWTHFQEHRLENPTVSIFDFWVLHYSKAFQQHQLLSQLPQQRSHQNLPFKSPQQDTVYPVWVSTPPIKMVELPKPALLPKANKKYWFGSCFVPSRHISDIWHPPQFC